MVRKASANVREAPSVSLDKTRTLINECLDSFFKYQMRTLGGNDVNAGQKATDDNVPFRLAEAHQQQSATSGIEQGPGVVPKGSNVDLAPSFLRPSLSFKERSLPLSRSSNKGDVQIKQDSRKYIFLNLETYIISCFAGVECLNASFMTYRPSQPLRTASEGAVTRQAANPKSDDLCEDNIVFPDLDAKTLLLGDFAENGIWWAGVSIASIPSTHILLLQILPSSNMLPVSCANRGGKTHEMIRVGSDLIISCK